MKVVFARNKFTFLCSPSATFWSYLVIRTVLGVLTAASLMMFEGAVMATIQVVIFCIFFCGLECVGHSFAFLILRDVWSRIQRTGVAKTRGQLSHSSP